MGVVNIQLAPVGLTTNTSSNAAIGSTVDSVKDSVEGTMTEAEKVLVESIKSMLDTKAKLGLKPDEKADNDNNPKMRGMGYLDGHINEMFAHKAAELVHHTAVCASFTKVHSYKYIEDESFTEAMNKEMTAQGIPAAERRKALEFIPALIEELQEDGDWAEADFGFHPDLDEVMKIPDQFDGKLGEGE